MNIRVTEEDIEQGQRRDPQGCPVARALRREGVDHMGVGGMAVMMVLACKNTFVLLPAAAQQWITEFDWGGKVGPFEFEFYLPGGEQEIRHRVNHQPAKRCSSITVLTPPVLPARRVCLTPGVDVGFTPRLVTKPQRRWRETEDQLAETEELVPVE